MSQRLRQIFLLTTRQRHSFTLTELMIVIGLIGVIASIGLFVISSGRDRNRDADRVTALKKIQLGLERYYAKNGHYPYTPCVGGVRQKDSNGTTYHLGWSSLRADLAQFVDLPETVPEPLLGKIVPKLASFNYSYHWHYIVSGQQENGNTAQHYILQAMLESESAIDTVRSETSLTGVIVRTNENSLKGSMSYPLSQTNDVPANCQEPTNLDINWDEGKGSTTGAYREPNSVFSGYNLVNCGYVYWKDSADTSPPSTRIPVTILCLGDLASNPMKYSTSPGDPDGVLPGNPCIDSGTYDFQGRDPLKLYCSRCGSLDGTTVEKYKLNDATLVKPWCPGVTFR